MKLEEAIKILRQHNVTGASVLRITRGQALEKDLLSQVLDSCEQLISEKAEYKRLLKSAVEDMRNSVNDVHCKYCSKWHTDQCQSTSHLDCYFKNKFEWRYANEALALIGEEDGHDDDRFTEGYNFAVQEHREEVENIPAADVKPMKYCRMIPLEPDCRDYTDVFICTNCHQHIHLGFIRKEYSGSYCLECGAEVKDGDTE